LLNQARPASGGISRHNGCGVIQKNQSSWERCPRGFTRGQQFLDSACVGKFGIGKSKKGISIMKTRNLLSFTAALLLCQVAFAKMPFSNDMFGRVESTLDQCAQIDQGSAEKYAVKKKELVKDATSAEVEAARSSDEYKAAYKAMSEQLAQMPKDEVKNACAAALAGK
jgi:hypothetical protein